MPVMMADQIKATLYLMQREEANKFLTKEVQYQ